MMAPAPRAANSPPAAAPLAYLAAAAMAFTIAALGLPWIAPDLAAHYYHPHVLALTHVVTLGWITLAIMGASYQLVPIVLGCPIWSERLAWWQLGILVVGIAGMVGHFYMGSWRGLLASAALVAAGAAGHLLNVGLSLRGLSRWSSTARLVALGYGGLALTVGFGLALGANRVWGGPGGHGLERVHAHFHLALLGWVAPMILGVSARVYPMFLLTPEPAGWPARLQLWGVAAGAPLVTLGLLGMPVLVRSGAIAVALAALAHVVSVTGMVRRRRRPELDWGLRLALTGAAFLVPATLLGLALAFDLLSGPRPALAYAAAALGGWVSLTIAGMMLKIVPFLTWYRVWAPRAGLMPVPTLQQMAWPAAEGTACVILAGAMVLLPLALVAGGPSWIRAAGMVLALGALAFAAGLAHALAPLAGRQAREGAPAAARAS